MVITVGNIIIANTIMPAKIVFPAGMLKMTSIAGTMITNPKKPKTFPKRTQERKNGIQNPHNNIILKNPLTLNITYRYQSQKLQDFKKRKNMLHHNFYKKLYLHLQKKHTSTT